MGEQTADTIYFNGKVITVDSNFSICSAVATRGDRIVATGDDTIVEALAGPETRCVDLNGKAVIPGLIDTHAHMDREGLESSIPIPYGAQIDSGHSSAYRGACESSQSGAVDHYDANRRSTFVLGGA